MSLAETADASCINEEHGKQRRQHHCSSFWLVWHGYNCQLPRDLSRFLLDCGHWYDKVHAASAEAGEQRVPSSLSPPQTRLFLTLRVGRLGQAQKSQQQKETKDKTQMGEGQVASTNDGDCFHLRSCNPSELRLLCSRAKLQLPQWLQSERCKQKGRGDGVAKSSRQRRFFSRRWRVPEPE